MRNFLLTIVNTLCPAPSGAERPSPKIRITPEQADTLIRLIKTVPGYENCFVAAIAPTNSMEPTIDDGQYVVLDPVPWYTLTVGDIIWYEHPEFQAIHRIVDINKDQDGAYFICEGDNNGGRRDPVKVRPEHYKAVWRITLN